jgi:hypothetical protein
MASAADLLHLLADMQLGMQAGRPAACDASVQRRASELYGSHDSQ